MKRAFVISLALAACTAELTPAWQLKQDRILGVRATPPAIGAGEVAILDALVTSDSGEIAEVPTLGASAPFAPGGLFSAVHFNQDHWEIELQTSEQLDLARAELGLAIDAPVPLVVELAFAGNLYATKTVWLGVSYVNPPLPRVIVDDVEPAPTGIELDSGSHALVIEVVSTQHVRWFTSCGELVDDEAASARLRLEGECTGTLAVVVRDDGGGVAWAWWPIVTQ